MDEYNKKLDLILETLHSVQADLRVHVAVDEGMWRRVEEAELDLKEVVKDASAFKTKHAALVATVSTFMGSGLAVLGRVMLP